MTSRRAALRLLPGTLFVAVATLLAAPAQARLDPPPCSPAEREANPRVDRAYGIREPIVQDSRCRHLEGADFSGQTLRNVDFQSANLTGANFRGTTLIDVDFRNARLGDAEFRNAKIDGGRFCGATLERARDLVFMEVVGDAPKFCSKTTLDREVFDPDKRGWEYQNFQQVRWSPWEFITPADIEVDARYIPTIKAGDGSLESLDFGITLVGARFTPLAYKRYRGDFEPDSEWHNHWIPDMGFLLDAGVVGFRAEPVIAFSAGVFLRPISIVSIETGFIYAGPLGDLWDVPETDRGLFISLRLNSFELDEFLSDSRRALFGR